MVEPTRRSSRLAIAAGVSAAVTLAAGSFMLGRAARDDPPGAPDPAPVVVPDPAPSLQQEETVPLPTPQAPLGRADLIAAAAAAADAFSSGRASPASSPLHGRQFELRLPFGCAGPAPASGAEPLRWSYDEAAKALRVRAEPVRWAPEEWIAAAAAGTATEPPIEAVQGFWIAHPWTSSEACPPPPPRVATAAPTRTPPAETLGVAEFFAVGSSRVTRRDGQAFEAVEKAAPEALDIRRGLRLRLRGRIATAPDGRTIVCRMEGAARRPACLVVVAFDEVAIENPATDEIIATWDVSSKSSEQSGISSRN